ncbi:CAAX protease self-immunity family protein [Clostridium argentinense CDC 2741]|uniref:CAAX protease self-immunity family protein n=1 Tax=Clostridium argentinense CDC 2741 TaxID=1418104 RepID=A0A0C1QTT0_9CLOT|nr:type II CAAX endopeptidase family protein [Clostridium argentinense]ARC84248.1 CPBP family intramembrane metalloprotease [Clostridium argentinense]KIE44392.1 CAAX protease self-immunity family protein [Clostridium argentinense CDC 2741]
MKFINLLISAIIQVILFLILPFIWWLTRDKKQSNFLKYLGIKKPIVKDKSRYILTFIFTIFILSFSAFIIVPLFIDSSNMATSQFKGKGISALFPALIYAFLQTGLSEELFFRGFLTKRFVKRFGFKIGNSIQALLFGLMHGIIFRELSGILGAVIVTLITAMAGWLMGVINEKQSEGSIISSWLLHGCANTLASIIAMFNII